MKPIFTGESFFENVRERDGVYVDKTKHIYTIFQNPGYYFLSRPRRFGKSLLCSTVAALFRGEKELFEGLWIENHWDFSQVHPVIHLDMTKASNAAEPIEKVSEKLVAQLQNIAEQYNAIATYSDSPDLFFSQLLRNLHKKTGRQVVVIIDEYDKPMLDVINDPEKFSGIQNVVRSFYSQLKASAEHLHLVFLTGICKFAKTSIFSGLNNVMDISLSPRAAELVGFTEEEIDKNFGPHIERLARENDISVEQARVMLRQNYNGYTFGLHLTHGPVGKVYNPFAINNAMNEGMFVERWFASGNPSMLITLLKKHNFLGVSPDSMALTLSKLELASNPSELKPTALLYFSGYLTIKDFEPRSKTLILGFPNNEIAQCLTEVLLPSLMASSVDDSLFTPYLDPLRTAIEKEEFEKVQDLINGILSHVAFAMMEHRERYYQLVLFLLFNAAHLRTSAEVMNNLGRSDLEICLPDKVIVIELKVGSSAAQALAQAKDRGYANKHLASGKKVFLMGVVVGQTRREITELAVEKLA